MKFIDFIKDRVMLLFLQGFAMFLLAGFLYATGYPTAYGAVIFLCWLLVLLAYLAVEYYRRKRYFKQMEEVLEHVDQRYLLGELMPESFRLEDHIYQDMIRKSNKSVIERIRQIEAEQKDYRHFADVREPPGRTYQAHQPGEPEDRELRGYGAVLCKIRGSV